MSGKLKFTFMTMMLLALSFGFMHLFFKGTDFSRLHIFLYNLCTGGTIILYFTEGKKQISPGTLLFFFLSIFYAAAAFFEYYMICVILGIILAIIVESIRIKRFGFFPYGFFQSSVPVSIKFHMASLLCLSMGLLICSFAIVNEIYLHWLSFKKLTLNTFFLGFSFPLSLISLAVAFNTMREVKDKTLDIIKILSFWFISGGVVVFFIFILFESNVLELFISLVLFITVTIVLLIYGKTGIKEQQKAFLVSGITFLLITSITGVLYISTYFIPDVTDFQRKILLHYHAMLALYGWNLSGLAVICRFDDFPIRLHEGKTILLHWLIVLLLAPLGYYFKWAAVTAIVGYAFFLYILFFSPAGKVETKL